MPSQEDAATQEDQRKNDAPNSGDGPGINAKPKPERGAVIDGEECHDDGGEEKYNGGNKLGNKLDTLSRSITVTDWIVAACTVVITIATVINVKLVKDQLAEMRSSSEQSETLVKAAVTQAEAAKALAELTRDNQILSQRARIAPAGAEIMGDIVTGEPIRVDLKFVNYGFEGAEDFNFSIEGFPGNVEEWDRGGYSEKVSRLKSECMQKDIFTPGMTIFPVQVSRKEIPVNLADTEIEPAKRMRWSADEINGNSVAVVTGCFTYGTVNIRRHTFFCYYFSAAETVGNKLSNCRSGHVAD